MNRLEYNLFSKHPLRFRSDGKFKILMMSDIQETLRYDERTLRSIHKLIEKEIPDLVVLGGDNCDGTKLKTEPELKNYLDIFSAPMEKQKIPWVHVFGNHDHDIEIDDLQKTKLYERYEYCLSKHTEDIYGTTNFVLPIKHSCKDEIAFHVWGLDTNNEISDTDIVIDENIDQIKRPTMASKWDILHFDQLMWYWNSSMELEEHAGRKTHGILFMHIAPWEFQYVVDNPIPTNGKGSMKEIMQLGLFNSGIFSAILQRGDIKCIACGHSHDDCFEGSFCGITMCLDACAGYSPYGTDDLRGGRVFEIDENDTANIQTHMVHYVDL